jgi:hypothetical protein
MEQDAAKRRSERVTGVSNVADDLMAVLTTKLEGVAAIEDDQRDAEAVGDQAAPAAFTWTEPRARDRIEAVRERLGDRRSFIQPGQDTR